MTDGAPRDEAGSLRRPLRIVLGLLVGLALLLGAAVATLAPGTARLTTAQESLVAARDLVVEGDVAEAQAAFAAARGDLNDADRRLRRPWVLPLRILPVVGDDVAWTSRVVRSGVVATEAGEAALDAVDEALADDFGGDGRLPVGPLAGLAPSLAVFADAVDAVVAEVGSVRAEQLTGPVRRQRDQIADVIGPIADQARLAADVAVRVPPLLGADDPQRFLLFASNPAELRGTGGYLGAYAIATIDDGRLEIGEFASLFDLEDQGPEAVEPPNEDYLSRYRAQGGTGAWQNLNLTPDFPSAALTYERLWAKVYGEQLDGVIAVDPFAYEALLGVAGTVEVPGLVELDADNVVDYVTNGAYRDIEDPTERQRVLGAVAAATLSAFLERLDGDQLPDTARLLAELAGDRHLLLHAADPETQAVLDRAGVTGAFSLEPGQMALVINNASANKVDWFVRRHLDYAINLRADGGARTKLEVEFENRSPAAGVPRYVIGPNQPFLEAGEAYRLVSLFCGHDCFIAKAPESLLLTGDRETGRIETVQRDLEGRITGELGSVVVDTFVSVPSRSSAFASYEYVQPDVWTTGDDGRIVFRFGLRNQPTLRPPRLRIVVTIPPGYEVSSRPQNTAVEGDTVVVERTPFGDFDLTLEFAPAGSVVDDPEEPVTGG